MYKGFLSWVLPIFLAQLRTELLASFHFAFQSGSLSISQGCGALLFPKRNRDKSLNETLRPMSLLNVDYLPKE